MGVRQGTSSSATLFILFIKDMITFIKENTDHDDFLEDLHTLLFADDTVILATSKEKLKNKIKLLNKYCENNMIKINYKKSYFVCINSSDRNDKCRILVNDKNSISNCETFIYLGSPICEGGNIKSVINEHINRKLKDINKFKIFLKCNDTIPVAVKLKVLNACVKSSLLYSAETFFNGNVKKIEKKFIKLFKMT